MARFRLLCLLLYSYMRLGHGFEITTKTTINSQDGDIDETIFKIDDAAYLANTRYPKSKVSGTVPCEISDKDHHGHLLAAVLVTNTTAITQQTIEDTLAHYTKLDDVFSPNFLEVVVLRSTVIGATIESSAIYTLRGLGMQHLIADNSIAETSHSGVVTDLQQIDLPSGPYLLTSRGGRCAFSTVYRLYPDHYRDFMHGIYDTGDESGSHTTLYTLVGNIGDIAILVPSRLYSLHDTRPFAGYRVAVKDLFDRKGLITSAGSRALASISLAAESTAPSIQRIVNLGGVIVGKYKTAQFGSGAGPWVWQDYQAPFNPRGDGWLTCSASSSSGGCAVATYDWLDFAIGTDTGSSMRRPAAVSGTYGKRPSQGMMNLEGVVPQGGATDTAGVFARDPKMWVHFLKHWYSPDLRESTEKTGLSELDVSNTNVHPRTILYPVDYLPLGNPAAQALVENFVKSLSAAFEMEVKRFNFTATVHNASDPIVADLAKRNDDMLNIIDFHPQWEELAEPLISRWAAEHEEAFPPIDPYYRQSWSTWHTAGTTMQQYYEALRMKRRSVDWYEQHLQYSTAESCSASVLVYDIGTGGLPSYREAELNDSPDASFLAAVPDGTDMAGAGICPLFGCVDYTIPIGQVEYFSKVTHRMEVMPVTINMVVKRGCDFMLLNMIEKLADAGILRTVGAGAKAF